MLIVTHNNAIKNMVDQVIIMKDGEIRKNYMNEERTKGNAWGYDISYLLTGVLNSHPSSAIKFTADKRTDYVNFYHELLDNME